MVISVRKDPYPELIRREIAALQPYSRRVGERVEWPT